MRIAYNGRLLQAFYKALNSSMRRFQRQRLPEAIVHTPQYITEGQKGLKTT